VCLQIGKSSSYVRRETAEAVAQLHTTVAGRRPPPREWRSKLPTLAELNGDDRDDVDQHLDQHVQDDMDQDDVDREVAS
jgi:hypothetical protein